MDSGENLLEEHLRSGGFLAGAAKGRWRLVEFRWPVVIVGVTARDGRLFTLRIDCTGYPDLAPTGTLWDVDANRQLPAELWPRGGRVSLVFNPSWKGGAALYLPCDRQSIEGHANWLSEHSWLIWNPSKGLLQYVQAVCETLQSHELQLQAA